MKIVILDGHATNPGDLSWVGLEELGDVTVYERTPSDLIIQRSKYASILLTNKTVLGEDEFSQLPNLRYVGILATGYNTVDIMAAKDRGIIVTNIPAYSTDSVAQMVFALILELCFHVQEHSNAVYAGEWAASKDFSFWKYPLIELAGKTLGIVGFGRIGRKTAEIAYAFGMNVIGYGIRPDLSYTHSNFKWATMDELLPESDFVSLHCPLFPETKGIINKTQLAKMKKSAFLINTSRGPLVVEEDLCEALNNDRIAGAAVDVLSVEPPKEGNPLLSAKNCIITPHIAWATTEARGRLISIAVDNVRHFQEKNPINVVNI